MLFHANSASSSFEKKIVSSLVTDVFVMALSKGRIINANLYMLTGTKNKSVVKSHSLKLVQERIF